MKAARQMFPTTASFKSFTYFITMGPAPGDGPAQAPTELTFEAFYVF